MKKYSEDFLKYGHIGTYYGGFYDGKPDSHMTTATIRYTGAGRPYFMTRGQRVHLDEITREFSR